MEPPNGGLDLRILDLPCCLVDRRNHLNGREGKAACRVWTSGSEQMTGQAGQAAGRRGTREVVLGASLRQSRTAQSSLPRRPVCPVSEDEVPRRVSSLEGLRAQAHERLATTPVRALARQVGMTVGGLQRFLDGGTLQTKSRRKLFHFLMDSELEADERAAAWIRSIKPPLEELSDERQVAAMIGVLRLLREQFAALSQNPPLWLTRVAALVTGYEEQYGCRAGDDSSDGSGQRFRRGE